jgi:hypothetical protein
MSRIGDEVLGLARVRLHIVELLAVFSVVPGDEMKTLIADGHAGNSAALNLTEGCVFDFDLGVLQRGHE